jgi:3-methyladenine DNA glycosylase/8-oxoguanine DNA glycosylase
MHWILTISDKFSLTRILARPQLLLLPPFGIDPARESLFRIEQLASGHTIALVISQNTEGLLVEANERLTGKEREEVSRKIWRMLRMGENFTDFIKMAQSDAELRAMVRQGVRLLRGASLFEDVVKSFILMAHPGEKGRALTTWLVDRLGDPLPSNPTRHAFPTSREILWGQHLVKEMLGFSLGSVIIEVVEAFQNDGAHLEALSRAQSSLSKLQRPKLQLPKQHRLYETLTMDQRTMGLVMLCLGRYDYIPTDDYARQCVSHVWYDYEPVGIEDVNALFSKWQPWGGLVYWLSTCSNILVCEHDSSISVPEPTLSLKRSSA